ncbi:hypothetical protein GLW05_11825 [Pontibacillus yanchengensis]|uniref:DUF4363 family protein n=1 Tax=Pontibacillus yanchengensis TaxID=462910 RepID=A0A6I4ZZ99_9BACI|nr:hypothetical protein [Pontibacillus yanchengensis]MYL34286.1 hypothetical protein [Pontibacillus yanchengensis]
MKVKSYLLILVVFMIVASILFGVYSYYNNKAEQEIVNSLKIHIDSLDELQSRIEKIDDKKLNKEEISLASTLLTKQSYMIGTQLANYDEEKQQFYHNLYDEYLRKFKPAYSNGDIEKFKVIIEEYKKGIEKFLKDIET